MKIIVLGAGVVGVTSAWYLSQQGHEVTVIEKEARPAEGASHANAGQVSYGYSAPWAAPGIPLKAVKWLFQRHAPLVIGPAPNPDKIIWSLQMLRNCTSHAYHVNKSRMLRIAEYSRKCFAELRAETGIQYDERSRGTLQVFRTQKQVDAAHKDIEVFREDGIDFEVLDREGCIRTEPGLAANAHKIVGALRLPDDETGDCLMFTSRLTEMAAAAGVEFLWNTTIRSIQTDKGKVTGIDTSAGRLTADTYVLALGVDSRRLAAPLGIKLPIYPVKGYSLTIPIVDESHAPVSTVMDETYKIAITRLGDRIRVGGMAELVGYDHRLNPRRKETLTMSVESLFGGAGDQARAEFWTGLRPMTPDGTPIIGATPLPNLWLNTGHGTLGWTMSCGSARLLADLISRPGSQITPAIKYDDLACARYH